MPLRWTVPTEDKTLARTGWLTLLVPEFSITKSSENVPSLGVTTKGAQGIQRCCHSSSSSTKNLLSIFKTWPPGVSNWCRLSLSKHFEPWNCHSVSWKLIEHRHVLSRHLAKKWLGIQAASICAITKMRPISSGLHAFFILYVLWDRNFLRNWVTWVPLPVVSVKYVTWVAKRDFPCFTRLKTSSSFAYNKEQRKRKRERERQLLKDMEHNKFYCSHVAPKFVSSLRSKCAGAQKPA